MGNVIEIRDVWKRYFLEYRSSMNPFGCLRNFKKNSFFWALKEINVDVAGGQAVGVIGRNGSGKTTLLKIICGITRSTRGFCKVSGKRSGLFELGSGFEPELTGRENIYLNGMLFGLSRREIRSKIDSIIDFSELGDFIDTAVRTYSSGMYLRLGFAITTAFKSDILLIDEVLAVGDESFQEKCLDRIGEFKKEGGTIILVSHDMSIIRRLCERVILLEKGLKEYDGQTDQALSRYLNEVSYEESKYPTREIEVKRVTLCDSAGRQVNSLRCGGELRLVIDYHAYKKISNVVFGIGIYRDGAYLMGPNTAADNVNIENVEGEGRVEYRLPSFPFTGGIYNVHVSIHDRQERCFYDYRRHSFSFIVEEGEKKIKYGMFAAEGQWRHVGRKNTA